MSGELTELFLDRELVERIRIRLPFLFQLAELESSRAGKIGMEVGALRERIVVALLIYKFGKRNVNTGIPTTESEVDVALFGEPVSIKTITGRTFSGVKLKWTVDGDKAREFRKEYSPQCDMLFIQINWGAAGGMYYFPLETQLEIFEDLGRDVYLKLPKPGTNPRGVEITREALSTLANNSHARVIEISWEKGEFSYDPYSKWIDYWTED